MKKAKSVGILLIATLGTLLSASPIGVPAHARTPAEMELKSLPLTPEDPKTQDRLVNELYSHYVECLESAGNEELCYRRWWRECRTMFQGGECPLLEEKMFPTPANGDESC